MQRVLVLEDEMYRAAYFSVFLQEYYFVIVKTAAEAIRYLKTESWEGLFLDHDLGTEENDLKGSNTGYAVACWLEEHKDRLPPNVFIHSMNPAGAQRIQSALPSAQRIPFDQIQRVIMYFSGTPEVIPK